MKKTLKECQDLVYKWNGNKYFQDSYRHQEQYYLPDIVKELEGKTFENGLDIGPGYGSLSLWLKINKITKNQKMLDIMPIDHWIMYDFLQKYSLKFEQKSVFDLNEVEQYDLITMTQVFLHLKFRPDLAVRNIYNALKDGGTFISCILNIDKHPHVDADYYHDWEDIPKYGTAEESDSMVIFMADIHDYERLLKTYFSDVEVKENSNGLELIGICKK